MKTNKIATYEFTYVYYDKIYWLQIYIDSKYFYNNTI